MGTITSIMIQTEGYSGVHQDAFKRTAVSHATLIANHGLDGDRKAGRNPKRQVNLLSTSWLKEMAAKGYAITPGAFGEQLIVDGLAVEALPRGTRLRLGETAVGEITMLRDGCVRLEAAQGKTGLAGKPIGVMIRVVAGGSIAVGDTVQVLEQHADDQLAAAAAS